MRLVFPRYVFFLAIVLLSLTLFFHVKELEKNAYSKEFIKILLVNKESKFSHSLVAEKQIKTFFEENEYLFEYLNQENPKNTKFLFSIVFRLLVEQSKNIFFEKKNDSFQMTIKLSENEDVNISYILKKDGFELLKIENLHYFSPILRNSFDKKL